MRELSLHDLRVHLRAVGDPDGLEVEVFWTVPGGTPVGTRALDLDAELTKRGLPV